MKGPRLLPESSICVYDILGKVSLSIEAFEQVELLLPARMFAEHLALGEGIALVLPVVAHLLASSLL